MTESHAEQFQRAKQTFTQHLARFARVVPYMVENTSDQIQLANCAQKLRCFTEIIMSATDLPIVWQDISDTFSIGLKRLGILIDQLEFGFVLKQGATSIRRSGLC